MSTEQPEAAPMDSENLDSAISSEPEHEYRFRVGDQISSRYRVITSLGFGGFSEVYLCQDRDLPRTVAVKVLTEKGVGLQEARAAVTLDHPHVVQVIDFSTLEDGTQLIVFKYVEGETLETRLDQAQYQRLPLNTDTLSIVRQVAEVLDYAHGKGVIHRDVKPSNIILDHEGNAYLTDFGLAEVKKPREGGSVRSALFQRRLSGTIPYMAPEQLSEETPGDARSDQYSLGVVAYEMLTSQLPYRGRHARMIVQIATSEPIPPTLANPELPKGIEPVLLRTLDKDPAKRYPSCVAFAEELKEAARAYVAAIGQYAQAQQLFDDKRWRDALSAFEKLARQAPGFKDTDHYLEQARHQVRLLELYEQARTALKKGEYQDTLNTLNALTKMVPDYDVEGIRREAREGLAQKEKRSLDEQYQQAVAQFQKGEYQACLDTLAVIRKRSPNYPDSKEIEAIARKQVEQQHHLRELYTQGVNQMGQQQWEEAIVTFQELWKVMPGYEDVEAKLVTARHLARLTSYLRQARTLLDQEAFTACMDKLDELQRIEADYKRDEVTRLRQEVLDRLHERVELLLREEKFEDSLTSLVKLRSLSPDHQGLDELEKQAQEGIHIRDLRAELDDLYQQAEEHLTHRSYAEAFKLWQEVQRRKGDLDYPDTRNVGSRARDSLCLSLYSQAQGALGQGEPQQALELWHQVHEVDPSYPDSQRVEQRAQAMDLYNQALETLDKKKNPHRALELWHQVRQVDSSYRDSQRVEPRAQAMTLYDQALEALTQRDPEKALDLWRQVRAKDPNYQDSQRVEARAQAMNLYNQALAALSKAEYQQALELWRQVRESDPHFPDDKRVEQRATAMGVYSQALGALAQKDPQRALGLWQQVRATDPQYPDNQGVEKQAQAMIRRRKTQRLGFFLAGGAGIVALLLVGTFALMAIINGCPSPTITPVATTSPSPVASATPTKSVTPSTQTSSPMPAVATPTLTPSAPPPTTPPPSPTTSSLATAIQGASIFAAPNVNSRELGSVSKGEQVTVLGHSAIGQWYYVRDDKGIEGFVYIDRLEWPGDYESLPIISTAITPVPVTRTPSSGPPYPLLRMNLWDLPDGTCSGGVWYKSVFIQGLDGNGIYTYYWNGEKVAGPTSDPYTFEVHSTGGAIIGTGKVGSGDGQQIESKLYVREPDCAK